MPERSDGSSSTSGTSARNRPASIPSGDQTARYHRRPVAPSPSSNSAAASRGRTSRYHGIAALFSTDPSHSARGRQRQHTGGLDKLESDGSELYEYTADFDRLVIRIREDCFDEPSDDLPKDDPDHDVIEKSLS